MRVPVVAEGDVANFKDFTVIFDEAFGLDRDAIRAALEHEHIETRSYFWPPVHRLPAYAHLPATDLPVTDGAANAVLSLPMFGDLTRDEVDRVMQALHAIHEHADEIAASLGQRPNVGQPMASRSSARD